MSEIKKSAKIYSYADPNMIERRVFDEELDAKRVYVVNQNWNDQCWTGNTQTFVAPASVGPSIVKEIEIREIEKPVFIKETIIERIEVPVIQTQIVQIETPIIVKETIIERVEVPIYITKVETIEKQVIVKEYKDLTKLVTVCFVAQAVLLSILMLLKK